MLQNSFDLRSTAISLGSIELLQALGLWDAEQALACAINRVHVSEQGKMGTTSIEARDVGVDALGYVVPNMALGGLLHSRLMESDVAVLDQTVVTQELPAPSDKRHRARAGAPVHAGASPRLSRRQPGERSDRPMPCP